MLVVVKDGAFADGDAVEVAGQIGEGSVAGADGLGVDDPVVMAPSAGMDPGVDLGMAAVQLVAEPCAEDPGEGVNGNEELRVCLDLLAARGQPAAGDDEVHVGVIGEPARPGMEDRGEAGNTAQPAVVGGEIEQCAGALAHEQIKQLAGVGADGLSELVGDGEGDQVVSDAGQDQGALVAQPLSGAG